MFPFQVAVPVAGPDKYIILPAPLSVTVRVDAPLNPDARFTDTFALEVMLLAVLPKLESEETVSAPALKLMFPTKELLPPNVNVFAPAIEKPVPAKMELMVAEAVIVIVGEPARVSVPPLMI